MKRTIVGAVACAAALTAVCATPAHAITYGQPDAVSTRTSAS